MYQKIFKRYEIKYLISQIQKDKILEIINKYMSIDQYGKTNIRNIYFDTPNYTIIRNSIEKPQYKEKLRIRSYTKPNNDTTIFIELKKKYDGVVYKRRLALPFDITKEWLLENKKIDNPNQIINEIDYFISYYKNLSPSLLLSYDREAYYGLEDKTLRITFDSNIIARDEDLNLDSDIYGTNILPNDKILMEIKCNGGMPLWLTAILSQEKIYKQSFSKYGKAYENIIYPKLNKYNTKGEIKND